ncbi:MAG TPA: hypothetical protein VGN56_02370 [Candidatus Paceibacterota bacterium]|jgi:hypothetical protein|nr:hypothetical protein [Candidatus Paceibacterota bacterium]
MTIAELAREDKPYQRLMALAAILLAGSAGVGIGLLIPHGGEGKDDRLWIEQLPAEERAGGSLVSTSTAAKSETAPVTQAAAAKAALPATGEVVASKSGTVYYLPACSGVARILPANRVTYPSRTAAEAKGLKPAKNCKGL